MSSTLRASALARSVSSAAQCRHKLKTARTFATVTECPRPPPPQDQPAVEAFTETSKLRPYSARGPIRKELPLVKKSWPIILASACVGVLGWAAFMAVAMNQEKVSSSVVKQIMRTIRSNPDLRELLGDAIRPEPAWYLNGDPWITGKINQLQGNVDVAFRLKGHKGAGTVYFTSIRKAKGEPFNILRFRVIGDDGAVINLNISSYTAGGRNQQ